MKTINQLAERYVKLSLKIGQHSEHYVDAYYGPQNWRPDDKTTALPQLKNEALMLLANARQLGAFDCDKKQHRMTFLLAHIKASVTYISQLQGNHLDFYSECKAMYDVHPPKFDESHFDEVLATLDELVPGSGDLNQRLDTYRQEFKVSKDKLDAVFAAAINEARARTLKFIDIPEDENFNVELVNNQVWSAYNWYKGDSYSLIQLNTDHPIFIDRVIDFAAHEGYPGHHVFNALIEKHLVNDKGWMEYAVYNLFNPLSLLAEGAPTTV
jgi:hypothetical protein